MVYIYFKLVELRKYRGTGAMATTFGKELRKVRIDLELTLADLADKVGMSAAYISALETGRKPVPPTFVGKLEGVLTLDQVTIKRLEKAADESREKNVVISLHGKDEFSKRLAVAFARRLDDMSGREVKDFLNLLEPDKKG